MKKTQPNIKTRQKESPLRQNMNELKKIKQKQKMGK